MFGMCMVFLFDEKGMKMNNNKKQENRIPFILAIPEKIEAFWNQLRSFRYPLVRSFSLLDFAFILLAGLFFLAGCTPWLAATRRLLSIFASILALIPHLLHAMNSIREHMVPIQEIVVVILTVLFILTGESVAALAFPALMTLLYQAEAYAMLHREAVLERFETLEMDFGLFTPEEEKTKTGSILASSAFFFSCFCMLMAFIFAVIAIFHRQEPALDLRRCELFMLLSIPSAALYAFKMCHLGVFSSASAENARFRSDEVPARLSQCSVFAFSKTGTITDGKYRIGDICPVGIGKEDLLRIAAIAECRSMHPIAAAIRQAAGLHDDAKLEGLQETEEFPGKGVRTFFAGRRLYVGNGDFLDEHGIWYQVPAQSGSAIHVAVDSTYRGYLMISDSIRDNAFEALEELRSQKVTTLVMLTGDVRSTARTLAAAMNFDMVKPSLQPREKGAAVDYLRASQDSKISIACVGDGFHDSEMFAAADVSVCLNAEEIADTDICIFSEDIMKIPTVFRFCKRSVLMARITILSVVCTKLLLCILGLCTTISLPVIAVVDTMIGIGMVIYSLTALRMN